MFGTRSDATTTCILLTITCLVPCWWYRVFLIRHSFVFFCLFPPSLSCACISGLFRFPGNIFLRVYLSDRMRKSYNFPLSFRHFRGGSFLDDTYGALMMSWGSLFTLVGAHTCAPFPIISFRTKKKFEDP